MTVRPATTSDLYAADIDRCKVAVEQTLALAGVPAVDWLEYATDRDVEVVCRRRGIVTPPRSSESARGARYFQQISGCQRRPPSGDVLARSEGAVRRAVYQAVEREAILWAASNLRIASSDGRILELNDDRIVRGWFEEHGFFEALQRAATAAIARLGPR